MSTNDEYMNVVRSEITYYDQWWPVYTGDFYPVNIDTQVWSGYFSSRAALKYRIR